MILAKVAPFGAIVATCVCMATASFAAPPNGTTYISDLSPIYSSNGWGPIEKDLSNGEQASGDGRTLSIRGTTFTKGVGTHAPADVRYDLSNACSTFDAVIGIDDEVAPNGSVTFQVWVDGAKIYDSGIITGNTPGQNISVNVSGKSTLQLIVTAANDGRNDHADWANARITCGSPVAIPPGAVVLNPGDNIQTAVNNNSSGKTFFLRAGVYRLQTIQPKDGSTFTGESGAILNGSRLISGFTQQGAVWVANSQPVQAQEFVGTCNSDTPRCSQAEDLYLNDTPLRAVATPGEVRSGTWYMEYGTGRVIMGDNPTGRKVEIGAVRNAFYGSAQNVTVKGLIIEKYSNPGEVGAIHGLTDPGPFGRNWIIDSNEIRLNHGAGIRTSDAMQVLRNNIHHNGQSGVVGGGVNLLLDSNEIAYNNYAGYDYSWDAGGTKFAGTNGLIARGNYVHHNNGPGLWTDGENIYALYENNRTSDNKVAGIFHELGYNTVIRYNTVDRDGFTAGGSLWYGAGIFVASASNVEIYGNTVTNSLNGIGASYVNRGSIGRPYNLQNLYVHDNTILLPQNTAAGIVTNDDRAFTIWNNRFQSNTYQLSNPNGAYYEWLGSKTRSPWQAAGQDTAGTWR